MKHFILLIILLFLLPNFIFSHPHVWVNTSVTVEFDEDGLVGFRNRWVLDEYFGGSVINDYDVNGDGIFDTAETDEIYNYAFSNMRNYGYFNIIEIDGVSYSSTDVTEFVPEIFNGSLVYNFLVNCPVPANQTTTHISLWIYDDSYFIDFSFQYMDECFSGDSVKADVELDIDYDSKSCFGDFFPRTVEIDMWK